MSKGAYYDSLSISHCSADANTIITLYGKHLINLGESHDLIILNGINNFSFSSNFTYFSYANEDSVVDYVITDLPFTLTIYDLHISSVSSLANHAFLTFNLLFFPKTEANPPPPPKIITKIHFNHSYDDVYTEKLKSYLINIHIIQYPIERANYFSKALWLETIEAFPHTTRYFHQSHDHCPHNLWFDTKCKALHRFIWLVLFIDPLYYKPVQNHYRSFIRKEKCQFLSRKI